MIKEGGWTKKGKGLDLDTKDEKTWLRTPKEGRKVSKKKPFEITRQGSAPAKKERRQRKPAKNFFASKGTTLVAIQSRRLRRGRKSWGKSFNKKSYGLA